MKNKSRPSHKIPGQASQPGGAKSAFLRWYSAKAPLLHFGLKFCALTILFYLILLIPVCKRMELAVTIGDARLASLVLNLAGQHNHVSGVTLWAGDRSVISVVPTCSGFDFLCFFSAAVLVFPVPFAKKLPGVLIGLPLLFALNLIRIMSLYVVGLHYPGIFDIVHEQIWAILLIAASIILYIAWMKWAGPATVRPLNATA